MHKDFDYVKIQYAINVLSDMIKDLEADYLKCLRKKKFKHSNDIKKFHYQYKLKQRLLRNYLIELYDCLDILSSALLSETTASQVTNDCLMQKLCLERQFEKQEGDDNP